MEEVAETVENMAEKVEKISGDMADALPEGALKEMLLKVEETADRVDQTAEKTQAILEKVIYIYIYI